MRLSYLLLSLQILKYGHCFTVPTVGVTSLVERSVGSTTSTYEYVSTRRSRSLLLHSTKNDDNNNNSGKKKKKNKKKRKSSSYKGSDGIGNANLYFNTDDLNLNGGRGTDGPDGADVGDDGAPIPQTISGGPSLIFAMARRMLVWDDEDFLNDANIINDRGDGANASSGDTGTTNANGNSGTTTNNIKPPKLPKLQPPPKVKVLPRWHPTTGIADVNANFRNEPPKMNNLGYAALIRRNSRKRGKAGLWRHAFRMYNNMRSIELEQLMEDADSPNKPRLRIQREGVHFESALNACAKLGLWREALFIFYEAKGIRDFQQGLKTSTSKSSSKATTSSSGENGDDSEQLRLAASMKQRKPVIITQYMILSSIQACVRAMRIRSKSTGGIGNNSGGKTFTMEERRQPLDKAKDLVLSMEEEFSFKPTSMHINPLAAGYQFLNLHEEAEDLLNLLKDKSVIEGVEHKKEKKKRQRQNDNDNDNDNNNSSSSTTNNNNEGMFGFGNGYELLYGRPRFGEKEVEPPLEIHEYKDEASYSISVKNSISQGDWSSAIESLKQMTDSGIYAKNRSLNAWSEAASKRERRPRKTTWMKQREQILVKGIGMGGTYGGYGRQESMHREKPNGEVRDTVDQLD